MPAPPSGPPRFSRCPHCRTAVTWHGNPHRPFCSRVCRLIDLGGWLDERYSIAGAPVTRGGEHDADAAPVGE